MPRTASVLSACGMQFSDIQAEHSATVPTRSDNFDRNAVNRALDKIDAKLKSFANRLASRGFDRYDMSYRVDAHYAAQVWDIAVDLPASRIDGDTVQHALAEAFHAAYRRIFSVEDRLSAVEFLNWTGRVSVHLPQAVIEASGGNGECRSECRDVWFDIAGAEPAMIVRGHTLRVGRSIDGPAIIEEETTTLVLPPGARATLTKNDNYLIELEI